MPTCHEHTDLCERMRAAETRLDGGDRRMTAIEKNVETACVDMAQTREEIAKANLPQMASDMRGMKARVGAWGAILAFIVLLLSIFGGEIAKAIFGPS
jgi:hypothetical protein